VKGSLLAVVAYDHLAVASTICSAFDN